MKSFCSSKEKCYFGGQMRDKLGEKRQIWKLKNKNLQKLVQFLMLEIKRITSSICRWYVFFAKNHFPMQKWEKMFWRVSSDVTSPTISERASVQA